jgi:FixJ family two-component response regulator
VKQRGEVVYVVDDDAFFRKAIEGFLESIDMNVMSFESAEGFLRHDRSDEAACLILDLQLPEMNGLDLQDHLGHKSKLPIIFITGQGDIPSSVRAMKAGAMEFLTKPVNRDDLMSAVRAALVRDRETRAHQAELAELNERFSRLSGREREVLPLLVAGFLNKQSAAMLGISLVTLQIHRAHIMRKMAATSFADLVRMCGAIGIPETAQRPAKHTIGNQTVAFSPPRGDGIE